MRNALIVTYYYPPSGGPGVQRVLKFTRYLPDLGWRPLVLTVPEDAAFPVRDPSLSREIPADARVFRSRILEFYRLYRAALGEQAEGSPINLETSTRPPRSLRARGLHALRGALFIPDGRMGWLPGGTQRGLEICRSENVEVIFASGPPFTAHWIARRISERTGLPLVLDFRDPWTRAPFYPTRPAWARRLDQRLERSCLLRASEVITVNRAIRDDFLARYPELKPERLAVIPNGFDPADFREEAVAPGPAAGGRDPRWTLSHTGTLPARLPSGLVPAVSRLLAGETGLAHGMRILLAGTLTPETARRLTSPPLDGITHLLGYLPHADSVRLLLESDLLLLLIEEGPQARGMLTGKLFEYLGSGRPVLALAPEGEAAEILRETQTGIVVAGSDEAGILAALRQALSAFRQGRRAFGSPRIDEIERYSRPRLTAQLAEIFERIRLSRVPSRI